MSSFSGPISNPSNCVFIVDFTNIKCNPYKPLESDHGISDWYCFANSTVTYSCSEFDTAIYQIDTSSNITTIVPSNTNPQRGTFSAIAGYRYYGNKPINLVAEDFQHAIAPITMASNTFIYVANRVGAEVGTIYVYSPYDTANVVMYKGGSGVNGSVNTYITLTKGSQGTLNITNLDYYFITANNPVVITAQQSGAGTDKTILSPAQKTMYQRYINYYITSIGTTPSSAQNYAISDITYPVLSQSIADGSGGDAAQGLGYDYLCDRYSWGNVLSDYVIAAPLDNTIVAVYYWDSANTSWKIRETHNITGGTLTIPNGVSRDGSAGVGNTATNITGSANNMVSDTTTLWKWEGNKPFYLCINDSQDDEFSVLGWMSSRNTRTVSNLDNNIYDMSGYGNVGVGYNRIYNSNYFDGNNDMIQFSNTNASSNITNNITIECIINVSQFVNIGGIVTYGTTGGEQYALWTSSSSNRLVFSTNWPSTWHQAYSTTLSTNTWYIVAVTFLDGVCKFYINGSLNSSTTMPVSKLTAVANSYMTIGNNHPGASEYFKGIINSVKVYSKVLSEEEITSNFNKFRGKFNL